MQTLFYFYQTKRYGENMKTYNNMHGFVIKNVTEIKEINANLVTMEHQKSGASLFFLDRPDDNKTFAIAFKTIPDDDTGVFHILEHSVLCGSKKFPVKDPFTELIKGSVSTYLNAMTYGDRTVYPVSSKNDKALLGLVDVYLDAVLHPNAVNDKNVFMQEGYRYETDGEKLTLNGVVYNEMKGVYSSADEYADYLITRLVSPNSTYSYDSGGNPDFITSLDYDSFKEAHAKYYHPSNSYIFLDGSVDLDSMLPLINSYLKDFDLSYENIEISEGDAPITEPLITSYPIEKEEDDTDKTRIYLSYNTFRYAEREKNVALALATEAIADSNNALLTKRILQSGLCESFSLFPTGSYSTNALNVIFIGVKDGCEKELIKLFDEEISRIITDGIPKDNLDSALRRVEFNTREADYGSYPKGMVYMSSCIEAAVLGLDPAHRLAYEHIFNFLREKLNTDYYAELLGEVISTKRATLILHPDKQFTKKKDAALESSLTEKLQAMSQEEIEDIQKQNELFSRWQENEDSEEALRSIPRLKISDLDTTVKRTETKILSIEGCDVIYHPIHTSGISYAELFFNVSDIDEEDIPYVRLFCELMSEWPTVNGDASYFRNRVKKHFGMFNIAPLPIKNKNEPALYMVLRLSCLESEKDNVLPLIKEHLYSTVFDDENILERNAKQIYTSSLEYISARGESVAMIRNAAKHSEYDALNEALFGYSYHTFIKELAQKGDIGYSDVLKKLNDIRRKYLKRERLSVGITELDGLDFAKKLVLSVDTGANVPGTCKVKKLPIANEGIVTPATVCFVSQSSNLSTIGKGLYTGAFATLSNILSYEILWEEIRLKGGAYDTGFYARSNSETVGCYSYRDPNPKRTVETFTSIHTLLNDFLANDPDLTKYVIGTVGATDTVSTPRSEGSVATILHLSGRSFDDVAKARKESIDVTTEELARLSKILEALSKTSTVTVVAPRTTLEEMKLDQILEI